MKYILTIILSGLLCFAVNSADGQDESLSRLSQRLTNYIDRPSVKPIVSTSQTIEQLSKANFVDLGKFWKKIELNGAPFVERCNDLNYLLVTFLYRNDASDINVSIDIKNGYIGDGKKDMSLIHISNTDVWYRTYKVPSDWTTSYRFVVTENANKNKFTKNIAKSEVKIVAKSEVKIAAKNHTMSDIKSYTNNHTKSATQNGISKDLEKNRDSSNSRVVDDRYNKNRIPDGIVSEETYNVFDYFHDSSKGWFYVKSNIKKGTLESFQFESKILNNTRNIMVYKPTGYTDSDCEKTDMQKYPTIIIFDQSLYMNRIPVHVILDNLIAAKKIPPCVAILVDNQPTERREFELPLYEPFADFVALELMPWAYKNFKLIEDPNKTIIAGVSYGGLASSYIALKYPNLFGNVLSQSGSYWRGKKVTDSIPWLQVQYNSSAKLPIRFYMDCGLQETVMRSFSNFNFIENHRKMRDILKSKGYEVYYQEFQGGHEWSGWRKTLPDGLIILLNQINQ